jgi:hypothetical protein
MKTITNLIFLLFLCSYQIYSVHICFNKQQDTNLVQTELTQDKVPELSPVTYQVITKKEKRCLSAGYDGQGGNLRLEACALGKPNQLFRKIDLPNGNIQFMSDLTSMVVEIECASINEDVPLREWPDSGSTHQSFRFQTISKEFFKLIAAHSSKCLDSSARDHVRQKNCINSEFQEWTLKEYKMESPTNDFVAIKNQASNKCVQVHNAGFTMVDCSPTNLKQYFRFMANADGSMYIVRDEGLAITPKD